MSRRSGPADERYRVCSIAGKSNRVLDAALDSCLPDCRSRSWDATDPRRRRSGTSSLERPQTLSEQRRKRSACPLNGSSRPTIETTVFGLSGAKIQITIVANGEDTVLPDRRRKSTGAAVKKLHLGWPVAASRARICPSAELPKNTRPSATATSKARSNNIRSSRGQADWGGCVGCSSRPTTSWLAATLA